MKTKLLVLFFVFLGFSSCKKDRLKDEKEFLVGKWKWVRTIKSLDQPQFTFADSVSENKNYEIEFLKCGKMKYFENGKKIFTKKIEILSVGDGCYSQYCGFNIDLNREKEVRIIVYNSSKDTIYVTDYPFDTFIDSNGNPDNYRNIYVRE